MNIRMKDTCPSQWLSEVFLSLARMLKPNQGYLPSEIYMNYEYFMTTPASLTLLLMLADPDYEVHEMEIPPSVLEFNMGGSITLGDCALCLEGGEIKSTYKGMYSITKLKLR